MARITIREKVSFAKNCNAKANADISKPMRTIGLSRFISAAFPNIKDETNDARLKLAVIKPTSKNDAPRDMANIGMKILDITWEALARN
jgi:hypothetical protein